MGFKYEVNGQVIEFDNEPSESDIDEAASQIGSPVSTQTEQPKLPNISPEVLKPLAIPGTFPLQGQLQSANAIAEQVGARGADVLKQGKTSGFMSGLLNKIKPGLESLSDKKMTIPIGPLFRPSISQKDVGNFAVEAITDPRTYIPGGKAKIASAPIEYTIGAANIVSKAPGTAARFAANVPTAPVKDLRNILKRLGKEKVFGQSADTAEFVGQELAPRASGAISGRVKNLDPVALRASGLKDEAVEELLETSRKSGIKRLPTTSEADSLFGKTIEDAPEDLNFNVSGLKDEIRDILLENGVIDDAGNAIPGLVKDNRGFEYLQNMLKGLKSRISKNKPITSLIGDDVGKSGDALKFTDEIDKKSFIRTRANLLAQLTGDAQIDRHTYRVIAKLDDAAESAGVKGMSNAKASFKMSRTGAKAYTFIDDPKFVENVQGRLEEASIPKNVQTRELLKKLIGKDADEILDLVQSNRILTSPSALGRPEGAGFFASARGLARRGIRKFEEATAPKLKDLASKRKP